ncbi:MAG: acyl-CoA dehydrogenase [Acidimicrobiia bacterium]|nr:acyl-CoA dehydrogenase [Acidimicrobiia bacterium]
MDFELSETEAAFRDTLRRFVERDIMPVAREWEHSGRYPTEIVAGMRDLGLFGITIPEEHGGLGLGLVSLAIVFEEISRGWMGIAGILGSHTLACAMIARHGTEDQKRRWLPELATGARRTGIALTEAGAGSDLQGIQTRAWRDGDEWVIRGTKYWITNARYADPLPVLVKTDPDAEPRHRGMSVLLVPATSPGFSVERDLDKLGYKGTESCEVVLDDVRVPHENLLGGEVGRGLQQVLGALQVGRVNIAARSVGVSQRAYEEALAYSQQRQAFGQPISGFQAIQLKLADMATEVQAARLLTWWAADQADRLPRSDVQTGMAKLFASEVALRTTLESMRVHGGAGYSTELEVERLYRDAPLLAIGEGTNDILRTVIAKGLIAG